MDSTILQFTQHTVDGSEIPNNHRNWMYKNLVKYMVEIPRTCNWWLARCLNHQQYDQRMGVSLNGGTPISHPKMIIFSRKTHGVVGDPILSTTTGEELIFCWFTILGIPPYRKKGCLRVPTLTTKDKWGLILKRFCKNFLVYCGTILLS